MRHHYAKALLAAATLALVWLTGSATAGFPGANGRIIFQDYAGDNRAISAIDAGGAVAVLATPPSLSTDYENPTSSADGSKIAFDDGNTLFVMDADGNNLHQVAAGLTGATDPTWSPDGARLAYTLADTGPGGTSLGMVNADGSNARTFLKFFEADTYDEPAWSPDGTRIAYRLTRQASFSTPQEIDIAVVTAIGSVSGDSGGGWTFWTQGHVGADSEPNWSPDGSQLAFRRQAAGSGHVLRVTGPLATVLDLTPGFTGFGNDAVNPAWSPDGTKIAFGYYGPGGADNIWTINASDGSDLTQVTTSDYAYQPDWQPAVAANTPVSTSPQTLTVGGVSITFDSVSAAGNTTITTSTTGPAIPVGFTLDGSYYDVHTTAAFTTATLCISSPTVTTSSRLLHYPGPTDVTLLPVVPPQICSTSLTSFSPFAIVKPVADTTPPILSVTHTVNGLNGWNVTAPVALTITADDPGGSVAGTPACTDRINGAPATPLAAIVSDGVHVISCTVSDVAGNQATTSDTVKLDTKAPVVTYTGGGSYTTAQHVTITCSATDPVPGAGLLSASCPGISQPASDFTLGAHSVTTDVADLAGNVGHGQTSFTVTAVPTVTYASLCAMTKAFIQGSPRYLALSVSLRHVLDAAATSLCQELGAIGPALTPKQKAAFLSGYKSGVVTLAATGWLTSAQAATLIGLANQL